MPFKDIATADSIVLSEVPAAADKDARRALRRLQVRPRAAAAGGNGRDGRGLQGGGAQGRDHSHEGAGLEREATKRRLDGAAAGVRPRWPRSHLTDMSTRVLPHAPLRPYAPPPCALPSLPGYAFTPLMIMNVNPPRCRAGGDHARDCSH